MKRVLSIATALCLALCLTVTAFAATLNPALNKNKIKAGEDVTLTLTLDADITNVATVGFKVYFNSDLFTLTSHANGTSSNLTQISNVKTDTKGSFYNVSVMDTTSDGVTVKKGVLYTLTFTAKADIAGTPSAQFEVVDDGGLNTSWGSISTDVGPAVSVTVEGSHVHSWTKAKDYKAATCNAVGNIEYYTCSCGAYAKLENGKYVVITLADTVIPKNNDHKLNHVLAKAATCKAEGNIEYWECSDCHTKWSDKAHTKVVTKVSTDKVSHNFTKQDTSAAYLKSAANCHAKAVYYYSCTMCGAKGTTTFEYGTVDATKHDGTLSYKHISGSDKHEVTCNGCHAKLRQEACASTKAATCTKKAVCDLCHTEFGSLAKHTLTFVPEVKATCVKGGNVAYYQCSVCKQNFEDQDATKVLTKVTTEKTHNLEKVAAVAATCTKPGTKEHYKCKDCGKLFTDAAGKNATTLADLATTKAHDLEKVPEVAAGCTTPGTKAHYKCKDCGKLFTDAAGKNATTADKLVIPAAHKLAKTGAIAATCTTTGNKEYWTCTVCNKHFGDAAGKTEIALADATIPALGHKLTKTEKKDATCTATGCEAYWTCSQCKGIFADDKGETATTLDKLTIAKKDHTPGDYVTNAAEHFKTCTVCGTEIKDSRAKHDFVKDEATGVETCKTCGYAIGGTVGEDHKHTADESKWLRDETNHWHECTDANCTAHLDNEGHKFTTKSETVGKTTTTVSTCSVCGYVKRTETTTGGNTSGGSSTPAKDIQSGKTFDAGIALYVGLSLLSVTGGAIVIGKKKEF